MRSAPLKESSAEPRIIRTAVDKLDDYNYNTFLLAGSNQFNLPDFSYEQE